MKTLTAILFFSLFLISCQSTKPLLMGIQPHYEAVNPAAIIAVPIFSLPDPSQQSSIDPSIIISAEIKPLLQNKINAAFLNQPNINGYTFDVVEHALQKQNTWDTLNKRMKFVASRFLSHDITIRSLISTPCMEKRNFLEFYTYCLAGDSEWLATLNALSSKIMNADAALLVVITDLESPVTDAKYKIQGSFAVLLVDTNNGKLIWGNLASGYLVNPSEKQYFPNWSDLINNVFSNSFWQTFPGRIGSK